jgi:hypothetical protein
MSNRRRRSHHKHHARRRYRAHNPRRRFRRYRNPREGGSFGPIMPKYLMPALIGGVGAVGFDILWGYVEPKLPASLQGGWAATAAEVAVILAAMWGLDKALPRQRTKIGVAGLGALTIVAYNVVKGLAPQILPAGTPGLQGYMPAMRFPMGGLGRVRPAIHFRGYMPRTFSGLNDLYDPASLIGAGGRAFPAQGSGGQVGAVAPNGCALTPSADPYTWNS